MQISIHTKNRHYVFLTGKDASPDEDEGGVVVQMVGGDLTPAPVEEYTYEEEEDRARTRRFGFQPR